MPDISMCTGGECPKRFECHRYIATPTPGRQSYISTPPYTKDGCDHFAQATEEEKREYEARKSE